MDMTFHYHWIPILTLQQIESRMCSYECDTLFTYNPPEELCLSEVTNPDFLTTGYNVVFTMGECLTLTFSPSAVIIDSILLINHGSCVCRVKSNIYVRNFQDICETLSTMLNYACISVQESMRKMKLKTDNSACKQQRYQYI